MKKHYFLSLLLLVAFVIKAQTPIITMIADGDETGGTPKVVEIYANGTVDFSQYSLENQNNGSTTWSNTFNLGALGTVTDDFVYVYSDGSNAGIFTQNFPSVSSASKLDATSAGVLSINGDDRIRIVDGSSNVIDIYGVDGMDGSNTPWEYKDGYAKRNDATGPDTTFDENNWSFHKGDLNTHGAVQDGTTYESIIGIGTYMPQSSGSGPLLSEDFESGTFPPAGWTSYEAGDPAGWQDSTTRAHSPTHSAFHNDDNVATTCDDWLITPAIDLSGTSAPVLSYYENVNYSTWADEHNVLISTDYSGGDPSAATWTVLNSTIGTEDTWEQKTFDLSAYTSSSSVYIAFQYKGDYASEWYVDDVTIEDAPCNAPTNVSLSNITNTGVDVSWSAGGTETDWEIVWGAPGFTPDFSSAVQVNGSTSYQITGLTETTDYEIYMRSNCGNNDYSDAVGPFGFHTTYTNNDCSGAMPLMIYGAGQSVGHEVMQDTNFAIDTGVHPSCDTYGTNLDLWYTFLVPAGETSVKVLTGGDRGDKIEIAVYDTCGGTALDCQGRDSEHIIQGLNPNQQYYLQVWHDDFASVRGSFSIALEKVPSLVNDDCAGAVNLPVFPAASSAGNEYHATTTIATDGTVTPSCASGVVKDIFFKFTVPSNATDVVLITRDDVAKNLKVALYDACGGSEIACDDSYFFHPFMGLTAGNTYYIQLWHDAGDEGDFDISMEVYEPVPNDDCADAIQIPSLPYSVYQDATLASGGVLQGGCSNGTNDGVWYSFTGDGNDITITADPDGWDNEISVYDGGCGVLNCVARTDIHGAGGAESLTFTSVAGTVYLVNIAHYTKWSDQMEGPFTMTIESQTSAVNDLGIEGLNYYPNPVQNTLNINAENIIDEVSVMDMTGKLILHLIPDNNNCQVDLQKYNKGVYFVQVSVDNKTEVFKIIKK